jgi:U6 snRNA phosphodiesterase
LSSNNSPFFDRLRLPEAIQSKKPDVQDETQLDGRIRSIPHTRGNWASYVYIPIVRNSAVEELQTELISFISAACSLEVTPFDESELHISLTRLLILKHHWIDAICESIKQLTCQRRQFGFQFDSLEIYCNDEKTRTFVGVKVFAEDTAQLKDLVLDYDKCLANYKLPKYYDPPSFHYSILWCLGDQELRFRNILPELNGILRKYLEEDITEFTEIVKNIFFKCGNRLYNYQLKS